VEMFGADRSLLAEVVATDAIAGTTPSELFGKAVPVAARAGDPQSASFAHGLSVGEAKLTVGTSAMLDLSTGAEVAAAPDGTYALPLWRRDSPAAGTEPEDQFCLEGSVNTAGATIEWLVSVGLLADVAALDSVLAAASAPTLLGPALSGLGSPGLDPTARGVMAEIGLDTSAADIVSGAVLGIAARVAAIAEILDVGESIIVDGGLTRSRNVLQTIADLSGRTLVPAVDPETTLRGAAMLAAESVGFAVSNLKAARTEPIEPKITVDQRDDSLARFAELEAVARRS